jgi:hypothetical protein
VDHVTPNCPKELGVVMREVSLGRLEQFVLGISRESRPTLAEGNPAVLFVDWGHRSSV